MAKEERERELIFFLGCVVVLYACVCVCVGCKVKRLFSHST